MRSITAISAALLIAATVSVARADETDRLTYLTFSGPVQLPGVVLKAGTYTFRLADPNGDRHVVRVFEKSNNRLITTLMAVSNQRLEPVKDPYIMFAERPAGMPQAIKAWFYPGQRFGEEFVYPRKQAEALAKANHEPVLTTASNEKGTAKLRAAEVTRIDERGQEAAAAVAQSAPQSARADSPGVTAQRSVTPAEPPRGESRQARRELPQTASYVPLAGLLGALSLIGAGILSRLQGRSL
jgi:hypothetical protein